MSMLDKLFDGAHSAPELAVTLLGTGSVLPEIKRFGPSTLVTAGRQKLLFDFGRGLTIRLAQIGVHPSTIDANFLTHFHSDHTVGLPDVWLTAMVPAIDGSGVGRKTAMNLIGPKGTATLAAGLKQAYAADLAIRCACDGTPLSGTDLNVTEFHGDGIVYDLGGVVVTAFTVDHGHEAIKPAVGFRIDYKGRSAVISGDTRYCENLIRAARGADILVHEIMMAPDRALKVPGSRVPTVLTYHTNPEAAGRIFSQVRPKVAIYTHLILPGGGGSAPPTPEDLITATRATYDGPVVAGADLDRVISREAGIFIQHFDAVAQRYDTETTVPCFA